jgi:hypothetical protein
VVALALAVAANTALYSFSNAVFSRPLRVHQPAPWLAIAFSSRAPFRRGKRFSRTLDLVPGVVYPAAHLSCDMTNVTIDGEPGMHDPSTVIQAGGKFCVYALELQH